MVLTDEQNDELEEMLEHAMHNLNKLNEWERGFIEDNYKRWQQYGKSILLSEKQWTVLVKIYNNLQEQSQ